MGKCANCNGAFSEELLFCPNDGELVIIGEILKGTYRIESKLGEGGMATVFRATNILNNTPCAIKIIHPDMISSEINAMERLLLEALKIKKIHHPNIVKVLDFGPMHHDELFYITMELLTGKTLKKMIEEKGPLSYQRVHSIVEQVCAGINAAHERGIVHRDLKSENIFLLEDVKDNISIKIIDFGISSDTGNHDWSKQILGTPEYMSPEQCEGKKKIDSRSDVYSFGITIYEMLTGQTPFPVSRWDAYEIMRKQMFETPDPLSERRPNISRKIEKVILKALDKNREKRQQTILELAEEFKAAMIQDGIIESTTNVVSFNIKDLIKSCINQGLSHLANKEYPFAINCFNEAIGYDVYNVHAYYYCGIAYQLNGETANAISNFDTVIEIRPKHEEAYFKRGLCFFKMSELDLAIADFTHTIELNNHHLEAIYNRGLIYKQQGELTKAEADFLAVIQLNDSYAPAHYSLGLISHYHQKIDAAIDYYCKAIELSPKHVQSYVLRGFAYKAKGALDLAIVDCNQALAIDASYANAYVVRSMVYLAKSELDLDFADRLTQSKHTTDLSNDLMLSVLDQEAILNSNKEESHEGHEEHEV